MEPLGAPPIASQVVEVVDVTNFVPSVLAPSNISMAEAPSTAYCVAWKKGMLRNGAVIVTAQEDGEAYVLPLFLVKGTNQLRPEEKAIFAEEVTKFEEPSDIAD
jgi:hypothetical protein